MINKYDQQPERQTAILQGDPLPDSLAALNKNAEELIVLMGELQQDPPAEEQNSNGPGN